MNSEDRINDQPREDEETGGDESLIPTRRTLTRTAQTYIAVGIVVGVIVYFLIQTITAIFKVIMLGVGVPVLLYIGYRLFRQSNNDI